MKRIRLSGKHADHSFTVDDSIYEEMSKEVWHGKEGRKTMYAERGFYDQNKRYRHVMAHRYAAYLYGILTHSDKEIDPRETDHIDHDGLNNMSYNLRAVSGTENQMNRKPNLGTSRFKGVSWHKRDKKWQSQVRYNGTQFYLGCFTDETKAAKAYDTKARQLGWPDYGLNFTEVAK